MIEMKLQFCIAFVSEHGSHIGNFEMLPRTTFKPIKNCFDCRQTIPATESFMDEYFHQQSFDCSSVRANLADLVAQRREQSLRVRSALGISALAR